MTKLSFRVFLGCCAALAALWTTVMLRAATPPPANLGAHARLWKTELRGLASVQVVFKPVINRRSASVELGTGKPGYLFNDYIEMPVGKGTLECFVNADTRSSISVPFNSNAGRYFTILLEDPYIAGGPPRLEVIDDGGETDSGTPQITVRNFVKDIKNMRLTIGDVLSARFVSNKCFVQMRGSDAALYPLRTVGTETNGQPFDWNTDVDLRQNRRQTLLIYPDSYGRIRPRLIVDGETSKMSIPSPEGVQR